MKTLFKTAAILYTVMMGNVYAQKLSISYSPEERIETKTHSSFTSSFNQLTEDADARYERVEQTMVDAKKLVIKKISKATGKKVWEKTIPVDAYDKGTNSYFCDLERTGTGFILFMKRENSKAKESYVTGQLCDENLRPYGEEEQLSSIGFRDDGALMPLFYKVERSGNHFLLYPNYYFVNDFKNKPFKFTMIDERLKVTYEKEIGFPKDQFYQLHTVKLEENLGLKAVFLVSTNGKKNSDNAAASEYWVVNFNNATTDFKTENITIGDKFKYFGNDLADFDGNMLNISGQYNKTTKGKGYEGIFNIRYNTSTMKLESIQLTEYTQPMITEMLGLTKPAKGKLPASYSIQALYADASSDITYVLESTGSSVSKDNSPGATGALDKTIHSFDNIVLLKTNNKGDIKWFKLIKRSASDPYTTYLPTYSFESKGYTILLFNASATTAKTPDPDAGYIFSSFENMLVAQVYDAAGNLVSTDSFAPKVSKGMSCNMQTIRKLPDNNIEVSFDKVSKTYKLESITRAELSFE